MSLTREILMKMKKDDEELFLWYGWATKGVQPYFLLGPLSEIFTIASLIAVVITTAPRLHYTTMS